MKPPALVEFIVRFRERERENARLDSQTRSQPERIRAAARESTRDRRSLPASRSSVSAFAG